MRSKFMLSLTAGAAVMLFQAAPHPALAQGPALTGQVTSDADGAMEGVVVSANKVGSIVTVAVTTDAQGKYSFPEDRLEPGPYTIKIRAIGYDLSAPTKTDIVGEKTTNVDLKLNKTHNLAAQLSNAEWMMSIPGTEDQKAFLLNCVGCHTLERIVRSTHDADEWTHVVTRMMGYGAVSQPIKPQRMLDETRAGKPEQYRKVAEYLATINLSGVDKWEYDLKTLPRPSGRSTRAIVTEYQLPRPTIEPHDVIVTKDGAVWYSDFGQMFISKFDPKTLKLTEYPVKKFKANAPEGQLSLELDRDGKFWFDTMYQGSLGTLDPQTGKTTYYPLPPEWNDEKVQLNFVGLRHDVDGKVWTKSVGTNFIYRLDIASGKWERYHPTDKIPGAGPYGVYQVISDSKNNLWMAEFGKGYLGKLDAKTLEATWFVAQTPNARVRRLRIDDQDRILMTQYRANKLSVFDTNTEKFTDYQLPAATFPYRAMFDKNGELWTGGMHTDRAVRLDPKTGTSVEYLLPRETNMRTVFIDESTTPVTFWTGGNHTASLVRVEPLD